MRLGDPLGVTYKRYLSEKGALEFIGGIGGSQWHPAYYEKSFIKEYFRDDENVEYEDHTLDNVFYLQIRYVHHNPIVWEAIPGRWEWYWGAGVMGKTADITYLYKEYFIVNDQQVFDYKTKDVKDYDVGPEGVIGIQYTFDKIPMTIGYDFSINFELFDRTGTLKGYNGLAFRYNF